MKIYQIYKIEEQEIYNEYTGDINFVDLESLDKSYVSYEKAIKYIEDIEKKNKEQNKKATFCDRCPIWTMTKRKLNNQKNKENLYKYCNEAKNEEFKPKITYQGNSVYCENFHRMAPEDVKYKIKEVEVEE